LIAAILKMGEKLRSDTYRMDEAGAEAHYGGRSDPGGDVTKPNIRTTFSATSL